jgi:hypothetical protein
MPWVPTRQWVVSVPMLLRYWMASSRDLMAQVHTTIRTTIAQFYVNQVVKQGERPALTGPRCASVNGFSLHANTEIPAHRRNQLERLIRYTGSMAQEDRPALTATLDYMQPGDTLVVWRSSSTRPARALSRPPVPVLVLRNARFIATSRSIMHDNKSEGQ